MNLEEPSVTARGAATLGLVLDDVGATVLDVVYGRVDPQRRVSSVVIVDPFDPPAIPPHALVLGVGIDGVDTIVDLLASLAEHQGVGLVLREPVGFHAEIAAAAVSSGVVIFSLVRGVAWNQVSAIITNTISQAAATPVGASGDLTNPVDTGDLSSIADALATLLDAPITIEDLNSRIIAFSSDQNRGDQARKESVLGHRVPDHVTDMMRSQGFFTEIYASEKPVYIENIDMHELPRAVMRVTAEDEILGSIWAVVREPLTASRERNFVEAAKIVALYLLRGRVELDSQRRSRQALLTGLLSGGNGARSLAREQRIDAGAFCVIAVCLHGDEPEALAQQSANDTSRLARIANTLALQLTASHPGSVAGVLGDTAYGILPLRPDLAAPTPFAAQVGREFHDRSKRRDPVLVAIGTIVNDAARLSDSRRDADRAMRVLRSPKTANGRTVVRADEVQIDTVLFEVYDRIVREQSAMTGPVPELLAYDRIHDSDFMETLDAFLASFGDIGKTASRLHVHPNTCRYRLRRITEISGLDLDDPDARFNAMLQLRVLSLQ
ncbi:PucR family transcriptional regulator [Subtercola sp. YIM 133946]|uniref:PucR family transcriptional regulator n=1 Tax=Subtercola sp. YIM 133946 TaxID=3118909 RepID=UPI002F91E442